MDRKQLNSFKTALTSVFEDSRYREKLLADAEKRNQQKAESDALNVMVRQEMANLRKIQGANFDQNDQYALRSAALNKLSGNEEFVQRANAIGQVVGQYAGDGSAGRFGYRYSSQKEADAASKASRDKLFDQEGNARLPDFENAKYDPNTGKTNVPMVGKVEPFIKTASQETTDALKSSGNDIAAARAMEAQNRGDSASGRSVNPNGTIDDAGSGRYEALRQENIARNEQRAREAEEARKPKAREPFNYVNPNSPEGRIKARAEAEAAGRDDPTSEFYDREAAQARVAAATEREEAVRAQARADIPAAEEAYNKAVSRLKQMRQGQFGRPVPGGTERFYPPPSKPPSKPNQRQ